MRVKRGGERGRGVDAAEERLDEAEEDDDAMGGVAAESDLECIACHACKRDLQGQRGGEEREVEMC